jgi:tetratricopeptide (TPR) repeat protein
MYIQFFFVILTLFFFTRKRAKVLFGEYRPFKLKSWYALLVLMIFLFSCNSIFFSIFMKIKYNFPFFVKKPQVTILKKANLSETPEKYLKVEALNVSLWIPKEFIITRLSKIQGKEREWNVSFRNPGKNIRGIITLTNQLPYEDDQYFRKLLGHISIFDFEKYMLTNNWNPSVIWIRSDQQKGKIGSLIDFREIRMNGSRGFWERRQADEFFCGGFTLYTKEGDQFIGGYYVSVKKYLDESMILPTLTSIEFLRPDDFSKPQDHYEKGLAFYKRGDVLQAQVEFANAYMLSPQNPDFIFMFAKSLLLKEIENEDYVKDLLNDLLKIEPKNKEARKLLGEIEPKLSKETKKR